MNSRAARAAAAAALLALALGALPCSAQVAVNGTPITMANDSGSSPVSQAYTVPAASNLCLEVGVAFDRGSGSPTSVSVTYNGVSLTPYPTSAPQSTNGSFFAQEFVLVNPATGSNTLSISYDATLSGEIYYTAQSFSNCGGVRSGSVATANGATLTITSNTKDLVAAVADKGDFSAAIGPGTCSPSAASCTGGNNGSGAASGAWFYSTVGQASVTNTWANANANSVSAGLSLMPPNAPNPCPSSGPPGAGRSVGKGNSNRPCLPF